MRSSRISGILSIVFGLLLLALPALASEPIPGQFLVRYKGDATTLLRDNLFNNPHSAKVLANHVAGQWLQIRISGSRQSAIVSQIRRHPEVAYLVPNQRIHGFGTTLRSLDSDTKEQWALDQVHAREAWRRAGNLGSKKVIVAVIDTGADANHPDLRANILPGHNFVDDNDDTSDVTRLDGNKGHGTHCSGIVGATGDGEIGVSGISPAVSLLPIRFLDANGNGDMANAIKSIDYAIARHAHVISASWGANLSATEAAPLVEAIQRANEAGIIFVAAAGNGGENNDEFNTFPANTKLPNVISVTSTGPHEERSWWANFGERSVHIGAPGQDILSTLPGGNYGLLSGTSMAAPLVSGLIAFLKAQEISLGAAEIKALLQLTGERALAVNACHCRIDALGAVDTVLARKLFLSPATASLKVGETQLFSGQFGRPPYRFHLSNPQVGSISATGLFQPSHPGSTTVTVTDSDGRQATSLPIVVSQPE